MTTICIVFVFPILSRTIKQHRPLPFQRSCILARWPRWNCYLRIQQFCFLCHFENYRDIWPWVRSSNVNIGIRMGYRPTCDRKSITIQLLTPGRGEDTVRYVHEAIHAYHFSLTRKSVPEELHETTNWSFARLEQGCFLADRVRFCDCWRQTLE